MAKPVTAADFPPFVKPEEFEGLTQTELREKLERLRKSMELGVINDEGEVVGLDDSIFDDLPITVPGGPEK